MGTTPIVEPVCDGARELTANALNWIKGDFMSGDTVITPDALARSKNMAPLKLSEMYNPNQTFDEVYIFIFPSPDPTDEINGDGQLLEIWDCARDFSSVVTSRGNHKTTSDTIVYGRTNKNTKVQFGHKT